MKEQTTTLGTLKEGEPHPAASSALNFVWSLGIKELVKYQEAFSSTAIEGNRLAEICSETLARILEGKKVSDRYLLGLAWILKNHYD